MSLEVVEHYLAKMEAVSNYEKVVKENVWLKRELELERVEHADTVEQLRNKIDGLEDLRVKYGESEYGLQEFDAKVQSRVKEWQEKEMASQVEKRFIKETPRLLVKKLKAELLAYPGDCLPEVKKLIHSTATSRMNEFLGNHEDWPEWFHTYYQNQVEQATASRLTNVFNARVEYESEKKLQQKISVEWPNFIEREVTPFCRSSIITQLKSIMVPFNVSCDKCGILMVVTLSPENVDELIRRSRISVNCPNTSCKDLFLPHKIHITLGQIVNTIIQRKY